MFELSQLRCFVAVAEELHFGRAAMRLNMTQPPLSRQIQVLEHILGVQLFDRTNRRVVLTVAGRTFFPEAVRLLRLAGSAAASVRRVAQGETGRVAIGFTAASGYDFLPRALRRLNALMPQVDVVLHEAVTSSQLEALAQEKIDVALARPAPLMTGFSSQIILREPLLLALPAEHRLSGDGPLTLTDLQMEKFIGYSAFEARYFHDLILRVFMAENLALNITQQVSQIHSVLALVRAGLGIGLVPQSARHLNFEGVSFRKLDEITDRGVELVLIWRDDNRNPAAMRAREILLGNC